MPTNHRSWRLTTSSWDVNVGMMMLNRSYISESFTAILSLASSTYTSFTSSHFLRNLLQQILLDVFDFVVSSSASHMP